MEVKEEPMKEQELKGRLSNVHNALMQCEVKGNSAMIIVDVLRELQMIINTPIESEETEKANE